MLSVLEEDFARIPELLGLTTVVPEPIEPELELEPELEPERPREPAVQLGLF